jgi:hypothetical protein
MSDKSCIATPPCFDDRAAEPPSWLGETGGLGLDHQSGLNKSLLTSGSLWTFLRCFLGWPQNSHEASRRAKSFLYRFQTGLDWSRRLDFISCVVTEARRKPRTPALQYQATGESNDSIRSGVGISPLVQLLRGKLAIDLKSLN